MTCGADKLCMCAMQSLTAACRMLGRNRARRVLLQWKVCRCCLALKPALQSSSKHTQLTAAPLMRADLLAGLIQRKTRGHALLQAHVEDRQDARAALQSVIESTCSPSATDVLLAWRVMAEDSRRLAVAGACIKARHAAGLMRRSFEVLQPSLGMMRQ